MRQLKTRAEFWRDFVVHSTSTGGKSRYKLRNLGAFSRITAARASRLALDD
jgi:hypothetical protein